MSIRRRSRTVLVALGLLALAGAPAAAQVGHSPVQDSATPVATAAPGWQVSGITPLDIDGMPLALSPDGATIAGIAAEGAPCFWTVADLTQTCAEVSADGPPLRIDPDSIAWAPDSSAIAFSVRAHEMLTDGDIHVVERGDVIIRNVTDDGLDRVRIVTSTEPVPVDVMPAWTADSEAIVFARTVWGSDEPTNEIMRVPREGGDPVSLLALPGHPAPIFSPMRVLPDGSVLYTVGFANQDDLANGLWRLSPDSAATLLVPGTPDSPFPQPVINDAWEQDGELRIIGHSAWLAGALPSELPISFVWSSVTGEAVPLAPVTDEPWGHVYAGALSPDGQTILAVGKNDTQWPSVSLQGPLNSQTVLPEVEGDAGPGRPRYLVARWSDANLVLLTPYVTNVAYLVAVEPVTG